MIDKTFHHVSEAMHRALYRPQWRWPVLAVAGATILAAGVLLAIRGEGDAQGESGGASTPAAAAPTPAPSPSATPAPSPTPNRPPSRLRDELKKHVDSGRLDEPVFRQMIDTGEADGLVALDDEQVQNSIKRVAASRGVALTDDTLVQMRPQIYAELKRLVLAVAPDQARAVQDFESFGVVRVHFSSPQALLEVLKRPEVSGVRAIEEYKRP
jgi:hypothetical protein